MKHFLTILLLLSCSASIFAESSTLSHSGTAIAHDGMPIYFEVHGSAERVLFLPDLFPRPPRRQGIKIPQEQIDLVMTQKADVISRFVDDYRLVLLEYPGEPKPYTLTPATISRDYLAVADAAGVNRFGFVGYSFRCVTGLQLALRTDRMDALACGGFPVMDGPYDILEKFTRTLRIGEHGELERPFGRQFETFYESLAGFDDRLIQGDLKMPRLNWVGSDDVITLGEYSVSYRETTLNNREELEAAGWDVIIVPDKDHQTASEVEVWAPLVHKWLKGV